MGIDNDTTMLTLDEWLPCSDVWTLAGELQTFCDDRKLHLYAAACLRRVWPLLRNESARLAVEGGEQYADGLASRDALYDAWTNAEWDMAEGLWLGRRDTGSCDCPICRERDRALGEETTSSRVHAASEEDFDLWHIMCRVRHAERDIGWTTAQVVLHARRLSREREESLAQYDLAREILDDKSPLPRIDPSWLTWHDATVGRLAKAVYRERTMPSGAFDPVRLSILADALEEAGCTEPTILGHLRSPGPHVRGCWTLDILAGKR